MLVTIATAYADTTSADLSFALGLPAQPALHVLELAAGGGLALELRLLGASHQVRLADRVSETVACLPDTTPFQIDERLEVIGTGGTISIHDTHPNLMIVDKAGARCPDTTYWPSFHGELRGALREELAYFAHSIVTGKKPDVITPEESREAVRACLAAEQSARTGQIVNI